MARNDYDHDRDEYDDDELLDDELLEDDEEGVDERTAGIGAWLISITTHVLVLAILAWIFIAAAEQKDRPPVRAVAIPQPAPPEDPPPEKEPLENIQTPIDAEVMVENPVVSDLDLPVEEVMTEDEIVAEVESPKGREEAVSTSEMGGVGAFMAIGAGGGSAGAFGSRSGGGRRRAVGAFGGNRGSENAVERALRWFMRHQSPNGQWDVDGYVQNCDGNPKCEPGTAHTNAGGDRAITGYAVLAFLGAGYDHQTPNKFRQVVRRGLEWLVEEQAADGSFGRNYEQGIVAMALAEAYGMTNDPWLREPSQKAIDYLLSVQAQGPDGYPLGWDYTQPKLTRHDSSVTGWCVMALKSAKAAGLDVGQGMEGAERWLEGAWQATNPNHATLDVYGESQFPYTWNSQTDAVKRPGNMTCVGGLCAVFLGKTEGDLMLETMGNYIMNNMLPGGWPTDTYYLYYNTLTIFQLGGDRWKEWNGVVRDMLVDSQNKDGEPSCFDGSWNPVGAGGHKVDQVGRTLVTAYCVLSLQVYYRYAQVKNQR